MRITQVAELGPVAYDTKGKIDKLFYFMQLCGHLKQLEKSVATSLLQTLGAGPSGH